MFDPSKFRLDGKVALVTGAGAGIGRAISKVFAAAGASVVVTDRSEDEARRVASEITSASGKAVACACDVTKQDDLIAAVTTCVKAFGGLSVLVNNAGGGGPKPFDMPMTDFEWPINSTCIPFFVYRSLQSAKWKK